MTVIFFNNDESEDTKDTIGWANKIEVSGIIDEGDYKIHVSCELAGINLTNEVAARVLIDGAERRIHSFKPTTSNAYKSVVFMGDVHLLDGLHSVTLQFTPAALPQTAKIRRTSLYVEKH